MQYNSGTEMVNKSSVYSSIGATDCDWSEPPFMDDDEYVDPSLVQSNNAAGKFNVDENIFRDLNSDASAALRAMVNGDNVFLTGGAGTGKSHALRTYIREARGNGVNIIVAAPTGIAANNLGDGAAAIHRAFGIPVADCYFEGEHGYEAPTRGEGKRLRPSKAILDADVVVIDEISMCRIDLFSALVWLLKRGGRDTQLIVCGDFYQLPPVMRTRDVPILRQFYSGFVEGFAFESEAWDECGFRTCVLRQPMRQVNGELAENLELARHGVLSCLKYFNKRAASNRNENALGRGSGEVIHLVPTNREADDINQRRMNGLCSPQRIYTASIYGRVGEGDKPVPETLFVKLGMRVMTVANHVGGSYNNGSLGTVVDFSLSNSEAVSVLFDKTGEKRSPKRVSVVHHRWEVTEPKVIQKENGGSRVVGERIGEYTQLPLRPAYAITIHKSQGQTFDKVRISPRCFAPGQAYVALSRLTSLDGLYLDTPIPKKSLFSSDNVRNFYKRIGVE